MNFREYKNEAAGNYDILMDCTADEITQLIHTFGLDHTYGSMHEEKYYFLLDTAAKTITPVNDYADLIKDEFISGTVEFKFHAKDWKFEQYTTYEQHNNLNYTMESADTKQFLTVKN